MNASFGGERRLRRSKRACCRLGDEPTAPSDAHPDVKGG